MNKDTFVRFVLRVKNESVQLKPAEELPWIALCCIPNAGLSAKPQAIAELVKGFQEGSRFQTLPGVIGSGKMVWCQYVVYLVVP